MMIKLNQLLMHYQRIHTQKKLITVHQQLHKKNVTQEIVSYADELKRQQTIN